jgi:hypothetical protein
MRSGALLGKRHRCPKTANLFSSANLHELSSLQVFKARKCHAKGTLLTTQGTCKPRGTTTQGTP